MTLRWTLRDSLRLCMRAHHGQVDKAGMPYYLHPLAVNRGLPFVAQFWELDPVERAYARHAALLHDVLEDCPKYSPATFAELGVPSEVTEAVMLLSRNYLPEEPYYPRVRESWVALPVKIADIQHNLRPSRLERLPEADQIRLKAKYAHALDALTSVPAP